MKPEEIMDALNDLDNDLIKETEFLRRSSGKNKQKKNICVSFHHFGVLVACIGLFIIGNIVVSTFKFSELPNDPTITPIERPKQTDEPYTETAPTETSGYAQETEVTKEFDPTKEMLDLPLLNITGGIGNIGSGGGSHIVVKDLSEWMSSPWAEAETPEKLPVYNNYKYTEYFTPYGFDREDMEEWVNYIVVALDCELVAMNYQESVNYDSGYMSATTDTVEIYVDGKGNIRITFNELVLSEEYRMSSQYSEDEIELAMNRLIEHFQKLLNFSQPEKVIEIQYDFLGNEERRYLVYEGSGDVIEDLLNHHYQLVEFIFSSTDGALEEILIYNGLSCAEKMDDYPIVSVEEARELLLSGNYFSDGASSDFYVDEEKIAAVELLYPGSNLPMILIPYYAFYIELPDDVLEKSFPELNDSGLLKQYQVCYVPAIDSRYIGNTPSYGGLSQ